MSLLLSFDADVRREMASGELSPLTHSLRAELQPLIDASLPIPEQKARLTRLGGRCSFDGMLLDFDPWLPHEHKCPRCHRVFMDRAHDDWWAMGAQLWVAERAVQAAALHLTTGEESMGVLARRILRELAERYEEWPNSDNALGPTRPFFSTYLESIWLINLCHAIALLEQAGNDNRAVLDDVRSKLVRPSRDLIASFHEGRSNRQVWNEVAILSASRILHDDKGFRSRLNGKSGLFSLFAEGLLDDGTWYEGENYHLFAHRGLWYATQLLRAANISLPPQLQARFRSGFVTPFLGVLPDDTLPSRRDSQYKVSIRQWRFAEWCELGIAHALQENTRPDKRLTGTLHRLYHPSDREQLQAQHRHAFSTADSERNEPAGLLSRADLSWRALLVAMPHLPDAASWSPGSVCLPRQGLAVIRREAGQTYIALEGGHTGGGHGHPDRLGLTIQRGHDRWLEDPGTGSYVEQKLHWYRSTLAHAAPVIDASSQDPVPATLLAFEDRGAAGWMCKRVENVKAGVNIQRTIVVCDGYCIDLLEWDAERVVQVDLRIPNSFEFSLVCEWLPANPAGAGGLEDGFDFLSDVEIDARAITGLTVADSPNDSLCATRTLQHDAHDMVYYSASTPLVAWRAVAPGSPGEGTATVHWMRMSGKSGFLVGLWMWDDLQKFSTAAGLDGFREVSVTVAETEFVHTRTDSGWHIALKARHATSSIDLAYLSRPEKSDADIENDSSPTLTSDDEKGTSPVIIDLRDALHTIGFELGEAQYLQTEQTWLEAGSPSATVEIEFQRETESLHLRIRARTGDIVVPSIHDANLLDNERRDVNADGVELFLGSMKGVPWSASWLIVPANDALSSGKRRDARITSTTPGSPNLDASWFIAQDEDGGYEMLLKLPVASIPVQTDGTFIMEIIVNERPRERARRRGQLALSGSGGRFAYLRGDRAESSQARTFRLLERPGRGQN